MQVEVVKAFVDKDTRELRRIGDLVSYNQNRAEQLKELGFVAFEETTEPTVKELREECERAGIKAPRNATKKKLKELLGKE